MCLNRELDVSCGGTARHERRAGEQNLRERRRWDDEMIPVSLGRSTTTDIAKPSGMAIVPLDFSNAQSARELRQFESSKLRSHDTAEVMPHSREVLYFEVPPERVGFVPTLSSEPPQSNRVELTRLHYSIASFRPESATLHFCMGNDDDLCKSSDNFHTFFHSCTVLFARVEG